MSDSVFFLHRKFCIKSFLELFNIPDGSTEFVKRGTSVFSHTGIFAMFTLSLFCLGTIGIEPMAGVQPRTFFPWAQ